MIAQSLFSFEPVGVLPIVRTPCERANTGLRPAAAKDDPLSSKIAADQIERDGTRRRQIDDAVAKVRANPDRTALELAMLTGRDRYVLGRRLPDARKLGLVTNPTMRKCCISGKMAMTWRVG